MRKFNFLTDVLLPVLAILFVVLLIYFMMDLKYQAVKEHYPGLTRWEYFIYGHHLMIPHK